MRRVLRYAFLVGAAISCAPVVDTPAAHQRGIDAEDGARLAAALGALPGVWTAQATLRRPVADPLAPAAPAPPASAAVLLVVDDHADRAATAAAARQLVRGAAPEIAAPEIVVEVGAPRAELARVGPFTVERGSRRALVGTLALALVLVAGLALALARYARRGSSAQ